MKVSMMLTDNSDGNVDIEFEWSREDDEDVDASQAARIIKSVANYLGETENLEM